MPPASLTSISSRDFLRPFSADWHAISSYSTPLSSIACAHSLSLACHWNPPNPLIFNRFRTLVQKPGGRELIESQAFSRSLAPPFILVPASPLLAALTETQPTHGKAKERPGEFRYSLASGPKGGAQMR